MTFLGTSVLLGWVSLFSSFLQAGTIKAPASIMTLLGVRDFYEQLNQTNDHALTSTLPGNSIRAHMGVLFAPASRERTLSYYWLDVGDSSQFIKPLKVYIQLINEYGYTVSENDFYEYIVNKALTTTEESETTGLEQAFMSLDGSDNTQYFVMASSERYQFFIGCNSQTGEVLIFFPDAGILQAKFDCSSNSLFEFLKKYRLIKRLAELLGKNQKINIAKSNTSRNEYHTSKASEYSLKDHTMAAAYPCEWDDTQIEKLFHPDDPPPEKLIGQTAEHYAALAQRHKTPKSLDCLYAAIGTSLFQLRTGTVATEIKSCRLPAIDNMLSGLLRFTLTGMTGNIQPVWEAEIATDSGSVVTEPEWKVAYTKMLRFRQWCTKRSLIVVLSTPQDVIYLQIKDFPEVSIAAIMSTQVTDLS